MTGGGVDVAVEVDVEEDDDAGGALELSQATLQSARQMSRQFALEALLDSVNCICDPDNSIRLRVRLAPQSACVAGSTV